VLKTVCINKCIGRKDSKMIYSETLSFISGIRGALFFFILLIFSKVSTMNSYYLSNKGVKNFCFKFYSNRIQTDFAKMVNLYLETGHFPALSLIQQRFSE
jgi:hypothetical protein